MAPRKAEERKVEVGNISEVSGEVNIAAGDIIKNIKTIHQRALTSAEEAARARKLESKLLAQGIATLVQNLSAQASEGTQSDSPYKGLLPYSLNEAEIFYGRNKAKMDLLNHIKQSPLTVLHAESGAGKSSLLQAGIAAQLIANGHLAVYLRPRDADTVDFIKRMFLPELTQAPALAAVSLREFLRQVGAVLGSKTTLYLLLDQFEEFFNLLDKNEREPFLESLMDCLSDPSLKVRWVLALRAEALSKLAEFETVGVAPFKNMYSLHRLSLAEAQEAIIEPAQRHSIVFEPTLIDHILNTLTTNGEVTPTHLQLVCTALTDDLPADQTLTLRYYIDHEGDTEGILRDYLKRQLEHLPVEEQAPAWKVLRALITVDRLRALKTYDEIVEELKLSGISREQIDLVLARLVERRLLATQPAATEAFELAHDYLVKEIELDPQEQARKAAQELLIQETRTYQRHKTLLSPERLAVIEPYQNQLSFSADAQALLSESRKAVQEEQRVRERRRNLTLGVSVAVAIAMSLLALWGFRSSQEAGRQAAQARAGELAVLALNQKDTNYNLGLLFALEGLHLRTNARTKGSLLTLINSHLGLNQYLHGHSDYVSRVAFSSDGKLLASGGVDKTVILWDTSDPARPVKLSTLVGHIIDITSLAFGLGDKILASGSLDGTVIIWDVGDPAKPRRLSALTMRGAVHNVAFGPNGKLMAVIAWDSDGTITLWDVTDPVNPLRLSSLTGNYYANIAFNPDGRILASGTIDDTIILLDVRDPASPLPLSTVSASPDPNAGSSSQSQGMSLRAVSGELIEPISFHPARPVYTAQLAGDDPKAITSLALPLLKGIPTLAWSSVDGTVNLWSISDSAAPVELTVLSDVSDSVSSLAFSPQDAIMAVGSEESILLWDMSDLLRPKQLFTLSGHSNNVTSVAFSLNGTTLASGGMDKSVILWNVRNRNSPVQFASTLGHYQTISSLSFGKDSNTLALGAYDGYFSIWDISDPGITRNVSFLSTGGTIYSLALEPRSGKLLAAGTAEKSDLQLWDVSDPTSPIQLTTLLVHRQPVSSLVFSPDGMILASGSWDGTIIFWDIKDPAHPVQLSTLVVANLQLYSIAFTPNGKTLAVGGQDLLSLWDVSNPTKPAQLSSIPVDSNVQSVSFNSDGTLLASGSWNGTVDVWGLSDLAELTHLSTLSGHRQRVFSVAFSPAGNMLASGSGDQTVILWDLGIPTNPVQLSSLSSGSGDVQSLAFSPDGKELATGDGSRYLLWDMDIDSWIQKACQRAGRNFTQAEWSLYFPGETYHETCSQWPPETEPTPLPPNAKEQTIFSLQ